RMRGGIAPFHGGAPGSPALRDLTRECRKPAERVDQTPLRLRFAERLVCMLAVDRDERSAQVGELRQRRWPAVDPCPAFALRVEHPPQQDFVTVIGELLLGQPGADG